MARTNDLRKLITKKLKTVCDKVYYKVADEDAMYPHIVFNARDIDLGDRSRKDYVVEIDIWDKSKSAFNIEDLADNVEDLFNAENVPQEHILPTFFLLERKNVQDEDKTIHHVVITVQTQMYER